MIKSRKLYLSEDTEMDLLNWEDDGCPDYDPEYLDESEDEMDD